MDGDEAVVISAPTREGWKRWRDNVDHNRHGNLRDILQRFGVNCASEEDVIREVRLLENMAYQRGWHAHDRIGGGVK